MSEIVSTLPAAPAATVGEASRPYAASPELPFADYPAVRPRAAKAATPAQYPPASAAAPLTGSYEVHLQDAIVFMSQQPDNSLDLIITDPAYSGMNQKLKLGKGKIIGTYKEKGEDGKWFEEFHDTPENYTAFLRECYRALKPNRHIYLMFDSYSLLSLGPCDY